MWPGGESSPYQRRRGAAQLRSVRAKEPVHLVHKEPLRDEPRRALSEELRQHSNAQPVATGCNVLCSVALCCNGVLHPERRRCSAHTRASARKRTRGAQPGVCAAQSRTQAASSTRACISAADVSYIAAWPVWRTRNRSSERAATAAEAESGGSGASATYL